MNYYASRVYRPFAYIRKPLLVMKLTFLILVTALLQLSLASSGQNITLSAKNAPVEKIFREIQRQTGYQFLYTKQMLEGTHPVNISIKGSDLASALEISRFGKEITHVLLVTPAAGGSGMRGGGSWSPGTV